MIKISMKAPASAVCLAILLAGCGGGGGGDQAAAPPPAPVLVDAESVRAEAGASSDSFLAATREVAASSDEVSEPRRIDAPTPPADETSEPASLV